MLRDGASRLLSMRPPRPRNARILSDCGATQRRAPLPRLRIVAGFVAGLIVCTALAWVPPLAVAPAQAQKFAEAKKKAAKKTPAPKASQKKEDQPRTAFTPQDETSAAIPGIADARAWGDSAAE